MSNKDDEQEKATRRSFFNRPTAEQAANAGARVVKPPVVSNEVRESQPVAEGKREQRAGLPSLPGQQVRRVGEKVHGAEPLIASGEWDEDSEAPAYGLGAEGVRPDEQEKSLPKSTKGKKKKSKYPSFTLRERDVELMQLLARYKFAFRSQIERYFDTRDMSRRLTQLGRAGLLRNEMLTQSQALWTPTQPGMDVAGYDLPVLSHGRISASTVAHTVGLVNLGVDLERGYKDSRLLGDRNWPYPFHINADGSLSPGETVITERMITQAWNRQRLIYPEPRDVNALFAKLVELGEPGEFGGEAADGEEWSFVMRAPGVQHTPDMVLVRPRGEDGSCRNIAIELELSPKPVKAWRQILTMYKSSPVFATVIYFTHKPSIARAMKGINDAHVGMDAARFSVRKYSPLNGGLPFWG